MIVLQGIRMADEIEVGEGTESEDRELPGHAVIVMRDVGPEDRQGRQPHVKGQGAFISWAINIVIRNAAPILRDLGNQARLTIRHVDDVGRDMGDVVDEIFDMVEQRELSLHRLALFPYFDEEGVGARVIVL